MTETGFADCFSTLGIAPTGDVRAIKRAYAGILKTIDLAADPGRFARLRGDYEAALAQAPYIGERDASTPTPTSPPIQPGDAPPVPPPLESEKAAPRWALRDTSPRHRLKSAVKPLADMDNVGAWAPVTPTARMPSPLPPHRGNAQPMSADDDGESAAIAALLDDRISDRPGLLDAGLRRYGWDMVGCDLGRFGDQQDWLARLLDERARWQALAPKQRRKYDAQLARIAAAAPRGSVSDLYLWRQFAESVQAYPLWTAFVAGSYRLDEWATSETQARGWQRLALRTRERPLLFLIMLWFMTTILSSVLANIVGKTGAVPLMIIFGIVEVLLMTLMITVSCKAVLRRVMRNS